MQSARAGRTEEECLLPNDHAALALLRIRDFYVAVAGWPQYDLSLRKRRYRVCASTWPCRRCIYGVSEVAWRLGGVVCSSRTARENLTRRQISFCNLSLCAALFVHHLRITSVRAVVVVPLLDSFAAARHTPQDRASKKIRYWRPNADPYN